MNHNGGTDHEAHDTPGRRRSRIGRPWGPDQAETIRAELLAAYRRTLRRLTVADGIPGAGVSTMRVVVEAAEDAVESSEPVWLSTDQVDGYLAGGSRPVSTGHLVGAGPTGLLLFDKPIAQTLLPGSAQGTAPVLGALWWSSYFDGETFDVDADEPNLVTVHELSTQVSPGFPWCDVWDDSTLSDLGFFSVGLGGETVRDEDEDLLPPLLRLLMCYGAASR
ncbi:hypothetical protein [Gordonia iterans]